jgi:hypothetical protein
MPFVAFATETIAPLPGRNRFFVFAPEKSKFHLHAIKQLQSEEIQKSCQKAH